MLLRPTLGIHVGSTAITAHKVRRAGRWARPWPAVAEQFDGSRVSVTAGAPLSVALAAVFAPFKGTGMRLQVVLSDAHCRYLSLARPRGLGSRKELKQSLQLRFHSAFGEEAADWTLASHSQPFAQSDLVVGVRRQLLDQLHDTAAGAGLVPASVRPHWMTWARHWGAEMRRGSHWLVCADDGWACVGYLSDGHCRHVRTVRLVNGSHEVAAILAREQALFPYAAEGAKLWIAGAPIMRSEGAAA